jgi:predicted Fe-Mo cluster-binding NifX family protein
MGKYLVASSGSTLNSKVSGRFGHAAYFLVVDPENMEFDAFPGVGNGEFQIIGRFINMNVKKVIVGNIGPSAFEELSSAGCKVYLCRNMPVIEAVKKVAKGDIPVLQEPTLKDSIHSARKAGSGFGGRGESFGTGKGSGTDSTSGREHGRGMGDGMGRGRGNGTDREMGGDKGRPMGGGMGRGRGNGTDREMGGDKGRGMGGGMSRGRGNGMGRRRGRD